MLIIIEQTDLPRLKPETVADILALPSPPTLLPCSPPLHHPSLRKTSGF